MVDTASVFPTGWDNLTPGPAGSRRTTPDLTTILNALEQYLIQSDGTANFAAVSALAAEIARAEAAEAAETSRAETAEELLAPIASPTFTTKLTVPQAVISGLSPLSQTRIVGYQAGSGAPTSGTWQTGDQFTDSTGLEWVCTSGGTPGTWLVCASPSVQQVAFAPTGAWETLPPGRLGCNASCTPATGVPFLTAIWLPKGYSVGHFNFPIDTPGASGPTHQWAALYDNSRVQLAASADHTNTAMTAFNLLTYAVATIASGSATSFTTTYSGLHYLGIMVAVSTTMPQFYGSGFYPGSVSSNPLSGSSADTGQTTPPAFPHTAGALTVTGNPAIYGYVTN